MKTINHFEKNRPVHLALRDVYYERATKLLRDPDVMASHELDTALFEEIQFLLRTAREHGGFAVREEQKNGKDSDFARFINMLAGNVKSILSMLNLKHSVEKEGGFFSSFLEANHASVALQAEEYERRARDILRCLLSTLALAGPAFENFRKANDEAFTEDERGRYRKAEDHHRALIEEAAELPEYRKRLGIFSSRK